MNDGMSEAIEGFFCVFLFFTPGFIRSRSVSVPIRPLVFLFAFLFLLYSRYLVSPHAIPVRQ